MSGPAPGGGAGPLEPVRVEHPDPPRVIERAFAPALAPGWYRIEAAFPPEGVVDLVATLHLAGGLRLARRLPLVGRNHFAGLIRLPEALEAAAFEVRGSGRVEAPRHVTVRPAGVPERLLVLAGRVWSVVRQDPASLLHRAARFALRMGRRDLLSMPVSRRLVDPAEAYSVWRALFDEAPERDRALHEARLARLPPGRRPLLSVLCTQGPEAAGDLSRDLEAQVYPEWELVVAPAEAGGAVSTEPRIRVLAPSGPLLEARLGAGLAAASGRFVLAAPPGLRLRPHALLDLALTLDREPGARLVYADEDGLGADGERRDPRFKPAWSPEAAATHDYLGEPTLLHAETLRALGGWRTGLGEAARHDAKLRVAEAAGPGGVVHLAKLLAHRGPLPAVPERDGAAERQVVADHLARTGLAAEVAADPRSPHPRVRALLAEGGPPVSILIPTRDRADLLGRCLDTLRALTDYPRYEILVMDNGSREEATHALFRALASDARIRILPCPGPFNYSALNNEAARQARGEILVLLNNDIEVVEAGWLAEMAGLAMRPGIGCVGAKLSYPDRTLQHGGVMVGPGGGAGHGHKHAGPADRGYLDRLVTVTDVSAVTAACLAVRKGLYEEVGGLDETELRVAFNDVDLCLKVATRGHRNVWTPFAELVHHESVSRGKEITPERARRFAQEILTLQTRWGVRLLRDPYYSPHLTMDGEDYSLRTG